jgi:hypothetical protein
MSERKAGRIAIAAMLFAMIMGYFAVGGVFYAKGREHAPTIMNYEEVLNGMSNSIDQLRLEIYDLKEEIRLLNEKATQGD